MRRFITIGFALVGLTFLAASIPSKDPKLLYNPSPSAPVGWYKVKHKNGYEVGDMVAVQLPDWAEELAVKRGYIPPDIPVIKTIVGGPGDEYCVHESWLEVGDGRSFYIYHTDSRMRDMPVLTDGCRRLEVGKYLIASVSYDRSFDSRYFGPVDVSGIIGTVHFIGVME